MWFNQVPILKRPNQDFRSFKPSYQVRMVVSLYRIQKWEGRILPVIPRNPCMLACQISGRLCIRIFPKEKTVVRKGRVKRKDTGLRMRESAGSKRQYKIIAIGYFCVCIWLADCGLCDPKRGKADQQFLKHREELGRKSGFSHDHDRAKLSSPAILTCIMYSIEPWRTFAVQDTVENTVSLSRRFELVLAHAWKIMLLSNCFAFAFI